VRARARARAYIPIEKRYTYTDISILEMT